MKSKPRRRRRRQVKASEWLSPELIVAIAGLIRALAYLVVALAVIRFGANESMIKLASSFFRSLLSGS